jgi:hypothetical protein
MNIALAAGGIALMGLGGYTLGAQLIATMNASFSASPQVAMFTVAGLLADGVGFAWFMRGFQAYPLSLAD